MMNIEQIYDKALAHGSYAIESKGKVALVDPGRDPQPYLDFAEKHKGKIVAVFETHPHADFASSHIEFQKKFGATIYINPKVGVSYEFKPMEHGDEVKIGEVTIRALFTPGHSPDHNSYLLLDEKGQQKAVFTGDSLFIGDVGRPDLREGAGNLKVGRKELAEMMYDTVNTIFADMPDEVLVYPAHGAGSLCGKNMSDALYSTIGEQKKENWAFQLKEKQAFVNSFLDGQPFIPKYFPYDVELNRQGPEPMAESVKKVKRVANADALEEEVLIVDARSQEDFKAGHLKGSINIQDKEGDKFETWLGSLVGPEESFYLVAADEKALESAISRAAKIGYEKLIKGALVNPARAPEKSNLPDIADLKAHPDRYTIVDIRNESEVEEGKFFDTAVNIPLPELRDRMSEIKTDKPIVVHCAGGYRSAAGSSILESKLEGARVYDLSDAVNEFK